MLVPAKPPAVRQLEWPWNQVGVLTIGRARADRGCCLSEQRRQLLDEKYFGQLAFCSYQRCFEHLSLFTGRQRRGRRTPRAMRAAPGVSEGDAVEVAWCAGPGRKRTNRRQWGDA